VAEDLDQAVTTERQDIAEQPIHHHAERPDIAARVHQVRRRDLLGRHVAGRAQAVLRPGDAQRRAAQLLGEPEVEHLDGVLGGAARPQEQVLRLEIAMHDAQTMRFSQGLADLQDVAERRLYAERAFSLE
jgi:hypothetical protein